LHCSNFGGRSTHFVVDIKQQELVQDCRIFESGLAGVPPAYIGPENQLPLMSAQGGEVRRADREIALGEVAGSAGSAVAVKSLRIKNLKALIQELAFSTG
jgi:hypothetical protein